MTLEYSQDQDLAQLHRKVDHLVVLVNNLIDLTQSIAHVTDYNVATLAVIHRDTKLKGRPAR